MLAHMRLLSSEVNEWKSRVVNGAEQILCREPAEAAHRATEVQNPWINNIKLDGDKLKQNSETCVNPTALRYKLSPRDCMGMSWNTSSYTTQRSHCENSGDRQQKNNPKCQNRNGHSSCLDRHRIKQRYMNSILRC